MLNILNEYHYLNDLLFPFQFTYPHREIIRPWQKQNARIVLLEVGEIEIQKYVPSDEMHSQRTQFRFAKQTEHINGYQHRRIRIHTMIEEFSQRTTSTSSSSLFTIDSI